MVTGEWPKHFDSAAAESRWRKKWDEWGIHQWDSSRPREETFVVDTPPPTVSGSLHIGHVFSYTHPDIVVRYQRMCGRNIYYPMGWDDNGLPTERRVQNFFHVRCDPSLPYEGKDFVPPDTRRSAPATIVSRKKFIELCEHVTAEDEKEFERLFRLLGLSVDWNEHYETINNHCRRIAQLSFLRLYENGRVYSRQEPIMWDVDFHTAVAQAEVEDRLVEGEFHDIVFGVEDGSSFVISTTRPELLAACVAVVAHPDDDRYAKLFGKHAITPLFRIRVPILPCESADPEKGTGIMMVCTFGDSADVRFWREHGLPLRQIIGRDGRLETVQFDRAPWEADDPARAQQAYDVLAGKTVEQARKAIIELLRAPGSGVGDGVALQGSPTPCQHAVNFYEKGERPLEFISTRQWFIRILDLRKELLEAGRQIKWHPPWMFKRLERWIEGLNYDWCISRQRYFGVPIPIWYPVGDDGNPVYDQPISCAADALPLDALSDTPDGYAPEQRNQPGGFIGDPDVLDTWATSSMTPQLSSYWEVDPDRHRKLFPADIRPQAHEIIRTWAFYTITKAYLHEGKPPWGHIVISGWVLDPDRKKMSKSRGNVVTPRDVLEKHSTDAIRYWAGSARLGVDTAFDEGVLRIGRRLVTKIYNAAKFTLSRMVGVDAEKLGPKAVVEEVDRDMIRLLSEMVAETTTAFDSFDYAKALSITETFFWRRFCDTYIELVKNRAYAKEEDSGKLSALAGLKETLSVLLRCFAPFLPTVTEEVWSRYYARLCEKPSIHVAPWPGPAEFAPYQGPSFAGCFDAAVEVMASIRNAKTQAAKRMSAPVAQVTIEGATEDLARLKVCLSDIQQSLAVESAKLLECDKPKEEMFSVQVQF